MSSLPNLAPLTIPGVNTTDNRGVVSQPLLLQPLRVRIPMWDPPSGNSGPHLLELFGESNGVVRLLDSLEVTVPPPAIPDFVDLDIALGDLRLATRVMRLYYTITTDGGSTTMQPSIPITLDLDPPRWILPNNQLQFVVPPVPVMDEQYLRNNPLVAFSLPTYNIEALNDRIQFYLSNSDNPPADLPPVGGSFVNFSVRPRTATLDANAFRGLNNGVAYVFCKILDETGNNSVRSAGQRFTLNLGAATLPAPIIRPPIYNDQLIKRNDARLDEGGGVYVRVQTYPGFSAAARQQITVFWDGRPTLPEVVTQLPIDIKIPWATLRGPNATLTAQVVPVRYEITGLNPTPTPSASISVNVNLTIAGQDHPDAPALFNPTLAPVVIVGSTGIDTLTEADRNLPLRVRVPLFARPTVGETLSLYWNNVGPVSTYTVMAGDLEGNVVFFPNVPATVVGSAITAPHSVYYLTSNGFNEQRSPLTTVNARVIQLPAPQFRHTLTNGYLNCSSVPRVVDGVICFIPPNAGILENDEVRFIWQGYNENNWATLNLNVRDVQAIPWTLARTTAGASVTVGSFDRTLFPLRKLASATGSYQVWRGGVKVAESLPARVRVDLTYSTGCYCTPQGIVCN